MQNAAHLRQLVANMSQYVINLTQLCHNYG